MCFSDYVKGFFLPKSSKFSQDDDKELDNSDDNISDQSHVNDHLFAKVLEIWISMCDQFVKDSFKTSWVDKSTMGKDKLLLSFISKRSPLSITINVDFDKLVDDDQLVHDVYKNISETLIGEIDNLVIKETEQSSFVYDYYLDNEEMLNNFHQDEMYLGALSQILYLENKGIGIKNHISKETLIENIFFEEQQALLENWQKIAVQDDLSIFKVEDVWINRLEGAKELLYISFSFQAPKSDDVFEFKIFKDDIKINHSNMQQLLERKIKNALSLVKAKHVQQIIE